MAFDLKQLRAFEAVARHGGFSKASREAGLTQPTLSTHIRNLETSLGVRLFDRASRSVTLTPSGVILAEYAVKILSLWEECTEAVVSSSGQIRGSVTVEASTVPGEYLLPRWLPVFSRRYPEVQVTITVSDSETVLSRVERGDAPLGVAGSPASEAGLVSEKLCDDDIILVAPPGLFEGGPDNTLDLYSVSGIPLIRRDSGSGTQLAVESALRSRGTDPGALNWTSTLGSTRAVIEGVISGLGAAFVSRATVVRELREGLLVETQLRGLPIRRAFYLVRNRQRTLSPSAACFLEELLGSGSELEAP